MKHAAEARGRADWLVGMNMSRAYTLASRTLITIGRVQSPTLKLVVDRDREIQRFRPKPFYTVKAKFDADGQVFIAELVNDDTVSGQDSEGRLINTDTVRTILTELKSCQDATVKDCKSEIKTRKPPLCFSLSDAQSAASASFGYSAEETLQICQSLYEKKLTTYPRTDCNYLPESQYADVSNVLSAIKQTMPDLSDSISKADTGIKTKLWNDEKTTAHHAIIPTMSPGNLSSLTEQEKNLYRLIALRYIANFYPDFVYEQKTITVNVNSLPYTFKATGKTVKSFGWKSVLSDSIDDSETEAKNSNVKRTEDQTLPDVTAGQQIKNIESGFIKQTTTPPSKFTEGSLIKAMENIYKYVVDPEMKKLLKEGDGIGTSATRAGIISELKKRKYLELKGKNIVSTDVGRSVVDTIPERFKSPVMTAIFERILGKIEISNSGTTEFLKHQISEIYNEISKIKDTHIKIDGVREKNISKIYRCMECGGGLIRRNGKNGFWWGCENYPKCKQTYQDSNGKPVYK
jgi:DNA topoisomerase-3